jgi:hypothetical protein
LREEEFMGRGGVFTCNPRICTVSLPLMLMLAQVFVANAERFVFATKEAAVGNVPKKPIKDFIGEKTNTFDLGEIFVSVADSNPKTFAN